MRRAEATVAQKILHLAACIRGFEAAVSIPSALLNFMLPRYLLLLGKSDVILNVRSMYAKRNT